MLFSLKMDALYQMLDARYNILLQEVEETCNIEEKLSKLDQAINFCPESSNFIFSFFLLLNRFHSRYIYIKK